MFIKPLFPDPTCNIKQSYKVRRTAGISSISEPIKVVTDSVIQVIEHAAKRWQDPDYERRKVATVSLLNTDTLFSEESVVFAVNQFMSLLNAERLQAWVGGRIAPHPQRFSALLKARSPISGFRELLAALLTGHSFHGAIQEGSSNLLAGFVDDLRREIDLSAVRITEDQVQVGADLLIADVSDDQLARVEQQFETSGIPKEGLLFLPETCSIAILDGSESETDLEYLAEDVLLYDGSDFRSVSLIWAPEKLSPDPLLEAFAQFRAVFPIHPRLSGSLKMQAAFLKATGVSHAFGEGMEFLLSRGAPEVQPPGHIRWISYESLKDVEEWLKRTGNPIESVVANPTVLGRLQTTLPVQEPGFAHRPELEWYPGGIDLIGFLTGPVALQSE